MDLDRFDDLARALMRAPSRRGVLAGLASGLFATLPLALGEDAAAKRKRKKKGKKKRRQGNCTPNCSDRICGSDGCGGSCGTCDGDQVCQQGGATCACPAGTQKLSNGSCAITCADQSDCNGTACGCSSPSVEGERHCVSGALQPYVSCSSTADCPPGNHCQDIGFGGVCIGVCH